MPRSATPPYAYSYPPGTPAVSGTPISSAAYNNYILDIQTTLNQTLPLNYGGTGGTSQITGWDAISAQGTTIASASSINLTAATGPWIDISGTTTVTSVSLTNGKWRIARATGVFQITASSSLVVNGSTSVNFTTAASNLLMFTAEAGVSYVWSLSQSVTSVFADNLFRITGSSDATKLLAFEVDGLTTATTRTATPPDANFKMAALDVASQVITGGATVTSNAVGTVSSGTQTLNPGTRPLWDYTNNGAHTLAPGANTGTIVLDITNGASAGAITTSGWTKVVGAFTTTNTNKFRCFCSIGAAGSLLQIQAMQ